MKRKVIAMAASVAMLSSVASPAYGATAAGETTGATGTNTDAVPLQAWYTAPAPTTNEGWERQATQLGNGYMGAMVFGGVAKDKIQTNEKTVWSGGQGKNEDYNHGLPEDREKVKAAIAELQEILQQMVIDFSNDKNKVAHKDSSGKVVAGSYSYGSKAARVKELAAIAHGDESDYGSYQTLSEIDITDPTGNDSYADYRRVLDLRTGTATISYKQAGVSYTREYFMNYPQNMMVVRLRASEKGKLNRNIKLDSLQPQKVISSDIENNVLTMKGRPSDHGENGEVFVQQIKVTATGANSDVVTVGDTSYVRGADEIVLYMTAGTNYKLKHSEDDARFSSEDPQIAVEQRIAKAVERGYDKLLENHLADYQNLFGNVELNLGITAMPNKPTDQLLAAYGGRTDTPNTAEEDRYLENLYYQFGRYLLIASSRAGSLPANLQGVWANGLSTAWRGDYHANINVQMNYWLAESTNLTECHTPMIDYVNSQVYVGSQYAKYYPNHLNKDQDVRGWAVNIGCTPWDTVGNGTSDTFWSSVCGAWMAQDIWTYYAFTQDKEFLQKNYETLLGSALFFVDTLWTDTRDGTLVANPSYSPEHGQLSLGTTFDQGLIWETFDEVIKVAEALGKSDDADVQQIKVMQSKLSDPQIGLGGQFMEWKDEVNADLTGDGGHRHVNHLYMLHPGNQIVAGRSEQDDQYIEAMKNTLNTRGDGGTGWSKAWKVNFWARLRDGDHAHTMVSQLLKESTASNLFDLHPPFQIDGNFGGTAGMTEMLLQSQGDAVELLAAMPQAWASGSVTGLKARGNVEVDMAWDRNALTGAVLRPGTDNSALKVKGQNIAHAKLVDSKGNAVSFTADGDNTIVFAAKAGETYTIQDVSLSTTKATLESAIQTAQKALDGKAPTDELYDTATNEALAGAMASAKSTLNTTDVDAMLEAVDALDKAQTMFDNTYATTLTMPEGGIYTGPKQITLENPSPLLTIRYTLDGSAPTKNSPVYTGGFAASYGSFTLRAALFHGDKRIGDEQKASYLVTPPVDLAQGGTATEEGTSVTISGYPVTRITSGKVTERWATNSKAGTDLVVTVDLKSKKTFDCFLLDEFCNKNAASRVNTIQLAYQDGSDWKPIAIGDLFTMPATTEEHAYKAASFAPVTAQKVRLTMRGAGISIWEFSLYNTSAVGDKTALNTLVNACKALKNADYVDTTALETALAAAQTVQANTAATQTTVDNAYFALLNAKAALVEKASLTPGDLDLSGRVTAGDALVALKAATGQTTLNKTQQVAADVDGTDGVSVVDALMILQAAAGKVTLGKPADTTLPGGTSGNPDAPSNPVPSLGSATKAELEQEMAKPVDVNKYNDLSVQAYNAAMATARQVRDMASATPAQIRLTLNMLQQAKTWLTEKAQDNWVGTFSNMAGKYTVLNAGANVMYADWKLIDQGKLDASENRDNLYLQMTIQMQSENPNVNPADMWSQLTVKLRSADVTNKPGDTQAGNGEHNYGWDLKPSEFNGTTTLTVSIPLSRINTNKRGIMDWSDIQKLIVTCPLNGNKCTGDKYQYAMTIRNACIVDGAQTKAAADTLAATIEQAGAGGGEALTAAKATLKNAQDMLAGKQVQASLYDLNKANTDLLAAIGK